jgi:hypothetical protein
MGFGMTQYNNCVDMNWRHKHKTHNGNDNELENTFFIQGYWLGPPPNNLDPETLKFSFLSVLLLLPPSKSTLISLPWKRLLLLLMLVVI